MDIKLLKAFVTLANQGNYRSASELLHLTQPALTKQIQQLESQTDLTLFIRGRHGARMTAAGERLYATACDLLEHHYAFQENVRRIKNEDMGALALGFGISSFQLAPAWVNHFREKHVDIQIGLTNIPSSIQCQMLLEGKLQIGFLRLPVPEPLQATLLMKERLVMVAPSELQATKTDLQRTLNHYPLLQADPQHSPCLASLTARFLKENHLNAQSISVGNDIHTLLALVAAKNGVALLPASVVYFLPPGVTLIQPESKFEGWHIGVAWNPEIKHPLRDLFLQTKMTV